VLLVSGYPESFGAGSRWRHFPQGRVRGDLDPVFVTTILKPGVKSAVLTVKSAITSIMVLVMTILVPSVKLAVLKVEPKVRSEMLLIMVPVATQSTPAPHVRR
jgi:hypothetical protein